MFSNPLILAVGHGDADCACCGVLDRRMRVALPRSSRSRGTSPYRWSTRLALRGHEQSGSDAGQRAFSITARTYALGALTTFALVTWMRSVSVGQSVNPDQGRDDLRAAVFHDGIHASSYRKDRPLLQASGNSEMSKMAVGGRSPAYLALVNPAVVNEQGCQLPGQGQRHSAGLKGHKR